MGDKENYALTDEELDEVLGGIALPAGVDRPAISEALGVIFMGNEADSATIRERIGAIFARCGVKMGEPEIARFITDAREIKARGIFTGLVKARMTGMGEFLIDQD